MVRPFKTQDLEQVMKLWLNGNLQAHSFVKEEYWKKNYEMVESVLPDSEVYVCMEEEKVAGFIGMDGEYIEGIFVDKDYQRKGIGHQLLEAVRGRRRLFLNVYEKNLGAVAFYKSEGFQVEEKQLDEETGETEYRMVWKMPE